MCPSSFAMCFVFIEDKNGNYKFSEIFKFFRAIDTAGDFWYNEYGIIIMGGSKNAI